MLTATPQEGVRTAVRGSRLRQATVTRHRETIWYHARHARHAPFAARGSKEQWQEGAGRMGTGDRREKRSKGLQLKTVSARYAPSCKSAVRGVPQVVRSEGPAGW